MCFRGIVALGVSTPLLRCCWGNLLAFITCCLARMQRDMIYPHIASHDAAHGTNALFVRNLTDACYKFSSWHKAALLPPAPPAALSQPAKVCSWRCCHVEC